MAAITAAAITAGAAIYSSNKASKDAKKQRELSAQGIAAADPYAAYRPEAAAQLNELMKDPTKIADTPEYKARQQAVARQLAAQGYSGSGNALIAAADAAGQSFQQSFSNLALLSGAGVAPGGGYDQALQANQMANDNVLSSYAGIANNLGNLAATVGSRTGGGGQQQTFNQGVGGGGGGSTPRVGTGPE